MKAAEFRRHVQPVLDRYCISCHGWRRQRRSASSAPGMIRRETARPRAESSPPRTSLMTVPGLVRTAQHNHGAIPAGPRTTFATPAGWRRCYWRAIRTRTAKKLLELDREKLQRIVDGWTSTPRTLATTRSIAPRTNRPGRKVRSASPSRCPAVRPELARQPYAALVNVALPEESRFSRDRWL